MQCSPVPSGRSTSWRRPDVLALALFIRNLSPACVDDSLPLYLAWPRCLLAVVISSIAALGRHRPTWNFDISPQQRIVA